MAPATQSPAWRGHFRRQFLKTQACRFFPNGLCKFGQDCCFAHTAAELAETPDLRKTSICKLWLQGRCKKKDCQYAHGAGELRVTAAFVQKKLSRRTRQASAEEDEATCSLFGMAQSVEEDQESIANRAWSDGFYEDIAEPRAQKLLGSPLRLPRAHTASTCSGLASPLSPDGLADAVCGKEVSVDGLVDMPWPSFACGQGTDGSGASNLEEDTGTDAAETFLCLPPGLENLPLFQPQPRRLAPAPAVLPLAPQDNEAEQDPWHPRGPAPPGPFPQQEPLAADILLDPGVVRAHLQHNQRQQQEVQEQLQQVHLQMRANQQLLLEQLRVLDLPWSALPAEALPLKPVDPAGPKVRAAAAQQPPKQQQQQQQQQQLQPRSARQTRTTQSQLKQRQESALPRPQKPGIVPIGKQELSSSPAAPSATAGARSLAPLPDGLAGFGAATTTVFL